jgi:hypothetical protein
MKQRPSTIRVVVAAVRPSARLPPNTVSTRKKESNDATPQPIPAGMANAAKARRRRPR